jgi:hypothetical protein
VIGVQLSRLQIGITVIHRVHFDHFVHPIASSGLPLPT